MAIGVNPTKQPTGLANNEVLDQGPRLQKYNLSFPVSNMVGFAAALDPHTFEDLVSPSALQTAFELAHQLVFTTVFSSLLDPIDEQQALPASRLDQVVQRQSFWSSGCSSCGRATLCLRTLYWGLTEIPILGSRGIRMWFH